jgi:hypothetical protein
MRFYYTGASDHLAVQKDARMSLGGYVSSTSVPNGAERMLFGDISDYTIKRNPEETIVLKNEVVSMSNLKIWIESPATPFCTYAIGVVAPSMDEKGRVLFEKLESNDAIPYYTELAPADSEEEAIVLTGLFAKNSYLGIFLRRTLNVANLGFPPLDDLYASLTPPGKSKEEIIIRMSWD